MGIVRIVCISSKVMVNEFSRNVWNFDCVKGYDYVLLDYEDDEESEMLLAAMFRLTTIYANVFVLATFS